MPIKLMNNVVLVPVFNLRQRNIVDRKMLSSVSVWSGKLISAIQHSDVLTYLTKLISQWRLSQLTDPAKFIQSHVKWDYSLSRMPQLQVDSFWASILEFLRLNGMEEVPQTNPKYFAKLIMTALPTDIGQLLGDLDQAHNLGFRTDPHKLYSFLLSQAEFSNFGQPFRALFQKPQGKDPATTYNRPLAVNKSSVFTSRLQQNKSLIKASANVPSKSGYENRVLKVIAVLVVVVIITLTTCWALAGRASKDL